MARRQTATSVGERSAREFGWTAGRTVCDDATVNRVRGWTLYALGWLTAGVSWAAVAARSSGMPLGSALPYGVTAMGLSGLLGVGVWHMTGRLPWSPGAGRFLGSHALVMPGFVGAYATSAVWIDIAAGRGLTGLPAIVASPTFVWNVMFGVFLYSALAGVSYTIRASREATEARLAAVRAEAIASEARLAALRARVNPHFLFNALHSVGVLVSRDPAAAERAIEQLGALLRYVLSAREVVPFRDEWDFTRQYLQIEALRLGSRLTVKERVEDDALGVPVPALLLQPLVENAVRHGVAERPEGGRVTLCADVAEECLRLTVADDGEGASRSHGHGIGLATVEARLRVHYGDAARVQTRDTSTGFTVEVTIPLLAPQDDEGVP